MTKDIHGALYPTLFPLSLRNDRGTCFRRVGVKYDQLA